MISGMTGFGSAQFSIGKLKGVVEIKSLNHRYFDINFYLPIGFGSVEERLRQIVGQKIKRGKIIVSFKIVQKPPSAIAVNKDAIRQYLKFAKSLKKEFKINNDLSISDLTRLPGVIEVKETVVGPEVVGPILEKNIKLCLNGMVAMRRREGRSLANDVRQNLQKMTTHVQKIKGRAQIVLRQKKKQLEEEEFAVVQKGMDISEEISRLTHYIQEGKRLINAKTSNGKQLDFIAQEMQRETNTIGSKLQDKAVANAVIALKSKVEKIREQAQNIE